MVKEFKEFVMKGSIVDLAVAVIIGAAFGAIVTSLVADVIMPPIGMMLKGVSFTDMFYALDGKAYASLADAVKAGAPVIAYGKFLNTIINFLIVAFVIFMVIKQANRFKKPEAVVAAPPTKDCVYCTTSIPAAARRCPQCTSDLAAAGARA